MQYINRAACEAYDAIIAAGLVLRRVGDGIEAYLPEGAKPLNMDAERALMMAVANNGEGVLALLTYRDKMGAHAARADDDVERWLRMPSSELLAAAERASGWSRHPN